MSNKVEGGFALVKTLKDTQVNTTNKLINVTTADFKVMNLESGKEEDTLKLT